MISEYLNLIQLISGVLAAVLVFLGIFITCRKLNPEKYETIPYKTTVISTALIIAGLAASGVTEIEDIYHIERGYDCMEGKLRAMGADIEKVSVPDKPDSKTETEKAAV